MNTDRELLELAALAAGIEFTWRAKKIQVVLADTWGARRCSEEVLPFMRSGMFWEPLTDDGAARRLAVKLGISVMLSANNIACSIPGTDDYAFEEGVSAEHARRAITRAAAAIGRQMKESK